MTRQFWHEQPQLPRYFAYGSNMNPARVRERGINFVHAEAAVLQDYLLVFDKAATRHGAGHAGSAHANVRLARGAQVEGVLYHLANPAEIAKMDRFEAAPINYSRAVVTLTVGVASGEQQTPTEVLAWTYFGNPAVIRLGLAPERAYLAHLLAGQSFLSPDYYRALAATQCSDE